MNFFPKPPQAARHALSRVTGGRVPLRIHVPRAGWINYLVAPVFPLVLAFFLAACAIPRPLTPEPPTGMAPALAENLTLLPMVDGRSPAQPEGPVDMNQGAIIQVSADDVLTWGRQAWQKDGLATHLRPCASPQPLQPPIRWADFPLGGLTTDLALGLELKKLSIKKLGHNGLIAPQSLIDAALLPIFGVTALATQGRVDLGARALPALTVRYTVSMEVNGLSRRGGGQIWRQVYTLQRTAPTVNQTQIEPGCAPSSTDGQELGRQGAPTVIAELFDRVARDPELRELPSLAELAWLNRWLTDDRIRPDDKLNGLNKLWTRLGLPPDPEPNQQLMDNVANESGETDFKLDHPRTARWMLTGRVLVEAAGRLNEAKRHRAPTRNEQLLAGRLAELLGEYARKPLGGRYLQGLVLDTSRPWSQKKAALSIMARQLESGDHDDFLHREMSRQARNLNDPTQAAEATRFLVAVRGQRSTTEYSLPPALLFAALSGEDHWAAPLVLRAIEGGDLSPETLRLAGALEISAAWPYLRNGLDQALTNPLTARIPLQPSVASHPSEARPDAHLIVKALGGLREQPVIPFLRELLARWPEDLKIDDDLAAEIILSLDRLGGGKPDRERMTQWTELVRSREAPLVRRALLATLEKSGPEVHAGVLQTATQIPADPKNSGILIETIEFLGRIRYQPAEPFLADLAARPTTALDARLEALTALSSLADRRAEAHLAALSYNAEPVLGRAAKEAGERLVFERTLWAGPIRGGNDR